MQLFIICANISEMAGAASFTNLVLKSWSPIDLRGENNFIMLLTLVFVVD